MITKRMGVLIPCDGSALCASIADDGGGGGGGAGDGGGGHSGGGVAGGKGGVGGKGGDGGRPGGGPRPAPQYEQLTPLSQDPVARIGHSQRFGLSMVPSVQCRGAWLSHMSQYPRQWLSSVGIVPESRLPKSSR